jgi:hypothetical protein
MKTNLARFGRAGAIALLLAPAWASAHHGIGAQFDLSQTIELVGEVRQLIWRNPHVRITVAVADDNDREALWVVEAQSVSMLRSRDISEVLLAVGDSITLAGNPARGGKTEIYVTNVLLPDGREVIFFQRAEPRWNDQVLGKTGPRFATSGDSSEPSLGLFRVWSNAPGQGLLSNFNFDTHPLTNTARTAADSYDRLTDNLATGECAPKGMPTIIGNPYPRDFIDQGDTIVMRLEEYDTARTIHLASVPPEAMLPASQVGYSVGRWDNGTLVVTTMNVSDGIFYRNIPLSEDLEMVERFTPSADGSRLNYQMTVTDPAAFLEPAELELYWIYVPGVTVEPYECAEG